MLLLHCRGASERICYEKLSADFLSGKTISQKLLLPLSLEFDPLSSEALGPWLSFLEAHGIELVLFGRNFYRLEALPAWMEPGQAEDFIRELVADIREGVMDLKNRKWAHEKLAILAVTRALREDLPSSEMAARELLTSLLGCRQPLSCPRGRPTCFEVAANELNKRFGLSQSGELPKNREDF